MGFNINTLKKYTIYKGLISWKGSDKIEQGEIYADVKIAEIHQFRNDITEQTMEDGSIVDEHVINRPIQLSLQFMEPNNLIGRAFSIFDRLVKLWETKTMVTVTTQHMIYDQMVISNMPITHREPYRNSITVNCDLKQLYFSSLSTFTYAAKEPTVQMSASETVNGGPQQLQDIPKDSPLINQV